MDFKDTYCRACREVPLPPGLSQRIRRRLGGGEGPKRHLFPRLVAVLCALALLLTGALVWPRGGDHPTVESTPTAGPVGSVLARAAAAPKYPEALSFEEYSGYAIRQANPMDEALPGYLLDFAQKSAPLFLSQGGENGVYSPLSLWYALAICAEGSQGETRAQFLSALSLPQGYNLSTQARALYNRLYLDNEIGALTLHTSLWLNREFALQDSFLSRATDSFYAAIFQEDFSDPATGVLMGDWVAETTQGLLGGTPLELDADVALSLLTTLYYSDQWIEAFDRAENEILPFSNADGTQVQGEFLTRDYDSCAYWEGERFLAVRLSTNTGSAMYLYLPSEGTDPAALLEDPDLLSPLLEKDHENGPYAELTLKIPKFTISGQLDLSEGLKALGISDAFQLGKADFSPMAKGDLALAQASQEATVSIDEQGITAAAFTNLGWGMGGPPEADRHIDFILDRPFLFLIAGGSDNLPLFWGIVNQLDQ